MRLCLGLLCLPLAITLSTLSGCGGERRDPALEQAGAYVRYLTGRQFLDRSAFEQTFPDKKPSQFVRYLFSDIGLPEWSGVVDDGLSTPIPVQPANVIITDFLLPEEHSRQLLLKGDDSAGVVIVKAYLDPASPPQFVAQFPLHQPMPR